MIDPAVPEQPEASPAQAPIARGITDLTGLRAREELLRRLRDAYKAFNEARGWAEQIDYTLLGLDSREDLYKLLDEGSRNTERAIDALNGSTWDKARLFWDRIHTLLGVLRTAAGYLSGL